MPSTINTNLMSLNAQRNSTKSQNDLSTSIARLSSGLRINSAKDDAAGLAISERFTAQIRGVNQAARNANDGISLAQTAEGSLGTIGSNLQRMRELAVQSANATNSASDRAALQQEVGQLAAEIDRVAQQTQFNGTNLLDGSFSAQQFQVGANAGQTIAVAGIASARTSALGQYAGNTLTATTLTIGGVATSLGSIATDAKSIANAVKASSVAGFTISANATAVAAGTQALTATASGTAIVTVNGLAINVNNAVGNATTNRANTVAALNAQSSVTGVVATDTGSGVSLAAADGRNVTVSFAAGTATAATIADFGLAPAATTGATLNIAYNAPSGVTGNIVFAGAFANTTAVASTGTSIAAVDISSVAGANAALSAVDAALASVNSNRATLGAVQNRFSSTIENLQTTGENLSASRSRIQDADFAMETANLSRAQVLQQAGTAMIAQANQLPQQVLSLLR
jgi:flagellin